MAVLGLFQTAEGAPHWPTVLTFTGWVVAGALMFGSFAISRNDRLKSGPWIFDAAQQAAFKKALENNPKGKVAIEYSKADEKRGYEFATKMKALLEGAGFDVWGYTPAFIQSSGPPITGIQIMIKKDTASDTTGGILQRAFKTAGIDAPGYFRNDNNYEDDRALIQIGIKP